VGWKTALATRGVLVMPLSLIPRARAIVKRHVLGQIWPAGLPQIEARSGIFVSMHPNSQDST
jgi:hypothetical protein